MDIDEAGLSPQPGDPLSQLATQDLDRFGPAELEARIVALEAEIARTRLRIAAADTHRSAAEALFKSGG